MDDDVQMLRKEISALRKQLQYFAEVLMTRSFESDAVLVAVVEIFAQSAASNPDDPRHSLEKTLSGLDGAATEYSAIAEGVSTKGADDMIRQVGLIQRQARRRLKRIIQDDEAP